MKKLLLAMVTLLSQVAVAQTITLLPVSPLTYCAGTSVPVNFNRTGAFNTGNVFTAQLSDAQGSFSTAVTIGTAAQGAIQATIPAGQPAGAHYRIRVLASSPAVTSADNGADLTINALLAVTISVTPSAAICQGTTVTFTAALTSAATGSPVYQWVKNGAGIPGATGTTYTTSDLQDQDSIQCTVLSSSACSSLLLPIISPAIRMIVNPLPADLPTTATPASFCAGSGGTSRLSSGVSTINFSVSPITYNYIPVPDNAAVGPVGDDQIGGPYTLPFSFNFFGNTYTSFYISTNGNIQFGPTTNSSYTPGPLPNTTVKNFVALCWADVVVGSSYNSGKIRYFVDGVAPGRRLVIDYSDCGFYNGSNSSTGHIAGQIWLYETTRIVEVHLKESTGMATNNDGVKTLGVNNLTGTIGAAAPGRNGTAWQTTTPEAWRFIPPENYSFAWTPRITLNDSTVENPIASPAATTQYRVTVKNLISGCVAHGAATVTVNPILPPTVSIRISSGANPSCFGRPITFTATPTSGGTAPVYKWYRNNTLVGGQSDSVYTPATLIDKDSVRCILTSNAPCITTTTATSNTIKLTIQGGPGMTQITSLSGCNSVTYQGITYTATTTLRDTLRASLGCDSIYRVTNITVHQVVPVYQTLDLRGCNMGVVYRGVTYTASTVRKDTLRSVGGCDSIYLTANITVTNGTPLTTPVNLLPADNSTGLNLPIVFSWALVNGAQVYDLYIWKATDAMPANPSVAEIPGISFTMSGGLQYGAAYKWKVIARFGGCTTPSGIQTFSIRTLPDLIVDSVSVPATAASESDITISWRIKNQGTGATQTSWTDAAYFSDFPDIIYHSTTHYITSADNFSALTPGSSYRSNSYTFHIPVGMQGTYYVWVRTNTGNSVRETTDTNNTTISIPITVSLAPPPDLRIDNLSVNPLTAFSEDSVTITYTVSNHGTGPTNASAWTDAVYISQTAVMSFNNAIQLSTITNTTPLLPGAQYTVTRKLKLPSRINGAWYIHVLADYTNAIFENGQDANNIVSSDPLTVIARPSPNLVVSSLKTSNDTLSVNQGASLQWTLANNGAVTAIPAWSDYIYLSTDTVFTPGDRYITSYPHNDSIASLSESAVQTTIRIPAALPEGKYYFFVVADGADNVYEYGAETDNASRYAGPVYVVNPDLLPTQLTAPATASSQQTIDCSWTVRNSSRAAIYDAGWNDRIYLSANASFDPAADILLKDISVSQLMGPGDEYARQASVTLPVGISGNYYFIIVTDQGNAVFEKTETNNFLAMPVSITLSPWPDLRTSALTVPAADTVGTPISFSYTVMNGGTGELPQTQWLDNIYLSPSASPNDPGIVFLGAIAQDRSIPAGQSYTQTGSITLPAGLRPGAWYMIVMSDANNQIFENSQESNNRTVSASFTIAGAPPVVIPPSPSTDIVATNGQILSANITAGQYINLQWTVKNFSSDATTIPSWNDGIFLSADPVYDTADRLLGSSGFAGTLNPDGTYTLSASVKVPNDASGTLYLLVVADYTKQLNDPSRNNNTLSITTANSTGPAITIIVPPPSDLVPLTWTVPGTGTSAQPLTVIFTIKNAGPGITPATTWSDNIFLSEDAQVDGGDRLLGTIIHGTALASGAQYTDTVQVTLPPGISGNYVLLLKTDALDLVYEPDNNNNLVYTGIAVNGQQPSDLLVSNIVVPPTPQIAGSPVSVRWTLSNKGSNTATGYTKAAVYLSADTAWDVDDVLLGTLEDNIDLPPLAAREQQLIAPLQNITTGSFYVIVRSDLLNNILESDEGNNITASDSTLKVDVKELTLDELQTDTLFNGLPLSYKIVIRPDLDKQTLSIKLAGDSVGGATNRLFVRYNNAPSPNVNDAAAVKPLSAGQEAIVPSLQPGTWYLSALGNDAAHPKQPVSLLAHIIPFSITSVEAAQGGNTGYVTIKLNGARFEPGMTVKLSGGGTDISAQKLTVMSSVAALVTFDLTAKPIGLYTVMATNSAGTITRLTNGFEIVAGSPGNAGAAGSGFTCSIQNIGYDDNFQVTALHPPSARVNSTVTITIFFQNTGNVDIPIQRRIFTSPDTMYISFQPDYKDKLNQLLLECKEEGGPPDILRPGASGYIRIYAIVHGAAHQMINFKIAQ